MVRNVKLTFETGSEGWEEEDVGWEWWWWFGESCSVFGPVVGEFVGGVMRAFTRERSVALRAYSFCKERFSFCVSCTR